MDTTESNMTNLFLQLGLPAGGDEIAAFIRAHQLPEDVRVSEAPFWNAGQRQFLREQWVVDADWAARTAGTTPLVSAQNEYSLLQRGVEAELVPACEHVGVGLLPYFPLASGLLTGKYDRGGIEGPDAPEGARIARYESVRKQRWGRPEALAAARRAFELRARPQAWRQVQRAAMRQRFDWHEAADQYVVALVPGIDRQALHDRSFKCWSMATTIFSTTSWCAPASLGTRMWASA